MRDLKHGNYSQVRNVGHASDFSSVHVPESYQIT